MAAYPRIVHTEEGMRDGLQIENPDIPVADKIQRPETLAQSKAPTEDSTQASQPAPRAKVVGISR